MEFVYERSLTREAALAEFAQRWQPQPAAEWVMLDEALGRVLAERVESLVTLPVVRASARDGIAVKAARFTEGTPDATEWVLGVDYAPADTGDDFPDEFDAVVAVENLVPSERGLAFSEELGPVALGDGVRPAGSLVQRGEVVAEAGARLTPERVAACAVAGLAQVKVIKRPRVGFMATGSELVPWGSVPQRGQNIEANSLLVRGMLEEWGAECCAFPVVLDDPDALGAALDRALASCDIVMVNGGSSRGGEDFNSCLIEQRADWFAHGVRAVPGRPIGMALVGGTPVINVPGPVMAASLCMDWLIRGLVAQFLGCKPFPRRTAEAVLGVDVSKPAAFERILRVAVGEGPDGLVCTPLGNGGPVASIREADGQVVLPLGPALVPAGAAVTVELFD